MLHTFSYQPLCQVLYVIYKKQASEGNELQQIKVYYWGKEESFKPDLQHSSSCITFHITLLAKKSINGHPAAIKNNNSPAVTCKGFSKPLGAHQLTPSCRGWQHAGSETAETASSRVKNVSHPPKAAGREQWGSSTYPTQCVQIPLPPTSKLKAGQHLRLPSQAHSSG